MTILVIEDDDAIRDALYCYLEIADATVITCVDGKHATEWLAVHPPPTVILLDLAMPNMNGWEFRAWQRKQDALKDIPVVMVSAFHWSREQMQELQATAYLAKPYDLKELRRAILQAHQAITPSTTPTVRDVPAVNPSKPKLLRRPRSS